MHRPPAQSTRSGSSSRPAARTTHQRLPRTDRTCINRPPRNRTGRTGRHARARLRGKTRPRRPGERPRGTLPQLLDEIRPWRNHGPRRGLTREIRLGRRTQRSSAADGGACRRGGCSGNIHGRRRTRPRARRRRNTGNESRGRTRNSRRRRGGRPGTLRQAGRQGLARPGQDLARFGRGRRGSGWNRRPSMCRQWHGRLWRRRDRRWLERDRRWERDRRSAGQGRADR